ncbi:FtsK/SpoIIIE domain-containing protein [Allokutzneria albata]|uniref:DNA segregation ATPase FtsK/SpoIIIE, S-DNA-T family n=1 Tax=Allokutzneria albata TaxID=211114 RepID=A0A1H0CBK1_ALLAB|nr:FtsK/SpoIIIE domain-containing protein [Allokutzneria albata]SDN55193.1 DNA segregation ATPase FtsK/SpoIIIE, S-DNA-T family [Allokutzneria albata]
MASKKTDRTTRTMGREFKAALWAARHPGFLAAPATVAASISEFGLTPAGYVAGGLALGSLAWYRAHPGSFDAYAAPILRAARRRWFEYVGPRWERLMDSCALYTEHRRTGATHYPRVLRVRAYSPSIDLIAVRLARGQIPEDFEAKASAMAHALGVQRIAVQHTRPGRITLIVQRNEPFTYVIPAPEMPSRVEDVDLSAVYVGENEYGDDWCEPIIGGHCLTAGATGSGKNSLAWAKLRSMAPLIRAGLVKLWVCDPKYLEFVTLQQITGPGRYANTPEAAFELLSRFVADMEEQQRRMQRAGLRSVKVSEEFPLNFLLFDELGSMVAYNPEYAREITGMLARALSMGRTTGHVIDAYVQEPSKDVVEVRDLFPRRICLRTTSPSHADMVLGADMRARGAIADEIPDLPETAGIGYRVEKRSRTPERVRAAYTSDADCAEFMDYMRTGQTLRIVA